METGGEANLRSLVGIIHGKSSPKWSYLNHEGKVILYKYKKPSHFKLLTVIAVERVQAQDKIHSPDAQIHEGSSSMCIMCMAIC